MVQSFLYFPAVSSVDKVVLLHFALTQTQLPTLVKRMNCLGIVCFFGSYPKNRVRIIITVAMIKILRYTQEMMAVCKTKQSCCK